VISVYVVDAQSLQDYFWLPGLNFNLPFYKVSVLLETFALGVTTLIVGNLRYLSFCNDDCTFTEVPIYMYLY